MDMELLHGYGSTTKITGQVEATVNYYENINKGDLITTRRYFGFDTPVKVANPDIIPTLSVVSTKFSPDDVFLAVCGGTTTNNVVIYKRNGDAFTRLLGIDIAATSKELAFSPDGKYLAIATTARVKVYKIVGDTFTYLTMLSITDSADTYTVSFSSDSNYVFIGSTCTNINNTAAVVFRISNDTFTDVTTFPHMANYEQHCSAYSPNGSYIAVGSKNWYSGSAAALFVYKVVGETFTQVHSYLGTAGIVYGVDFSNDNTYLAVAMSISPYLKIYKRNGDTFTELSTIDVLPTVALQSVRFSSDGMYLAVSSLSSPYVTIYKRNGDNFTKLANLATLPTGASYGISFANLNSYMVIGMDATPYVYIYKADILGDFAHKYTSLIDLNKSNYVNFGYAKSTGLANDTNKKIVTLPIK